ncbi:LPXTG cell wall anchor domain-containing protein [Vagococcus carniphilus]|uniref:LPXTG cell wall anchor domain-containing protein n=1 Tax=Vagococcus carniphilus TaxID=218144 RepID=UPI003B595AFB
MKKNSLRLSAVVLACVPFLIGGTHLANAEEVNTNQTVTSSEVADAKPQAGETKDSASENAVTKESEKDQTSESAKDNILKVESNNIKGKKGETGDIFLAKVNGTVLKGEFKPFENDFIKVERNLNRESKDEKSLSNTIWTAKKAVKDGSIQLEFKADLTDAKTKEALAKEFSNLNLENQKDITIKTEKIKVNFKDVDKPIDPTKDKAVLPITVANKKDKLIVSVKDAELKATFTAVKNDKIDLKADGTFTIPDKNKDAKFTEKVTLSLDTTDANYKKIAESAEYKGKEIQTEYKNLDAAITRPAVKTITLTYKVKELAAKINGGGTLAFNDVDGVKITGTFKEIKDNEFFSLDAKGNWKAKKAGEGSIDPTFTISKESLTELQKKYPEQDLKIETSSLKVNFTETGSGSNQKQYAPVNKKEYAPVKKLPQTGEEKMRFAGIIGIVVLVIVGLIFFMKKKKNNDDDTDENNN